MSVDLAAYFERIGYSGSGEPNIDCLRELHYLHPLAIPFENLTTLMRRPVLLDIQSIQDKMISGGRGGYCFEHNRLFADALEQMGFEVDRLAARVVWQQPPEFTNPRTHMILRVDLGGRHYLCDVGFGGVTLTAPLPFEPGDAQATPHERFRLREVGKEVELHVEINGQWRPVYRFDLQPQLPVDFEVLNHYVSTHPQSHFLTTLIAARPTDSGRYALNNNRLIEYPAGGLPHERALADTEQIKKALVELFGIALPQDDRLDGALQRVLDDTDFND